MRNSYKTLFGLAMLLMALGFSSCFDILEEYRFNADGSGTAKMEVDISKMMALMEGFGSAMDSLGGGDGEGGKMDEMFEDKESIENLKKIPGISNVVNLSSRERKVIGYTFDFENVAALNTALVVQNDGMGMGSMLGKMGAGGDNETENDNSISYTGKKFHRSMDMKMPEGDEDDEETKQGMEMAKMMFNDAKYTLRYEFPSKVKKVKGNDAAVVGADGKTVTVENTIGDLLNGKATMTTDIRLKK
jgi:hypothetical protein